MLNILIVNCFLLLLGTVTDEKWKLPSEKEQEKANQTIRELFKEEFASSAPAVKAELAIKLFNIATDTNDDPAGKYVLLREAALLAADNNVPLTLRACDELIKRYEGTKAALLEP